MCGIAGYVGDSNVYRAGAYVTKMMASLARRGPDGEGKHNWPTAVLGHRRLAIFDLSDAGKQPMLSGDGKVGVVFNGAIYNFRELRADLEEAGYRFHSETDTEVLIHGYREWGIDTLISRLRGMFAIGLWDDERRKLFLVRDRLGVKPLIYAPLNGRLAFASTVRALRQAGLAETIDDQAITEYLEFGYVTDDRTIYKGLSKLPAASILEWSRDGLENGLEIRSYWTPPKASNEKLSFDDAVMETERLFLRSVELRLIADVPVGALLSGGIDSTLVCWAISKLGGDIQTFTVSTPGDPADEAADAQTIAQRLGVRHHVIELFPDDAPDVDELVSAYGEPFACASALGMLRVSQAVKPFATVLLTGDGGDDVFLGYPEHKNLWLAQRFARKLPAAAANSWLALKPGAPGSGLLRRLIHFADYATGGLGAVANAHDGLPVYDRYGMRGDRLADANVEQRAIPWSQKSARNVLQEFLDYDRRTRFVGEYMTKVDGGAMHYALEARSPFLDHELWNFAAALPFEIRLRRGELKAVLRECARRHVGEEVAAGAKRGFTVPVQRWLAGRWRPTFERSLKDSLLEQEGYIRADGVRNALAQSAERGRAPMQLWYLYVLETWFRHEYAAVEAASLEAR
jgi:asparagine synthase (glutamine-hydrolysing)